MSKICTFISRLRIAEREIRPHLKCRRDFSTMGCGDGGMVSFEHAQSDIQQTVIDGELEEELSSVVGLKIMKEGNESTCTGSLHVSRLTASSIIVHVGDVKEIIVPKGNRRRYRPLST